MKTETKDNHDKAMEAFSALVEALERLSENDRKRVLYSTAVPAKNTSSTVESGRHAAVKMLNE